MASTTIEQELLYGIFDVLSAIDKKLEKKSDSKDNSKNDINWKDLLGTNAKTSKKISSQAQALSDLINAIAKSENLKIDKIRTNLNVVIEFMQNFDKIKIAKGSADTIGNLGKLIDALLKATEKIDAKTYIKMRLFQKPFASLVKKFILNFSELIEDIKKKGINPKDAKNASQVIEHISKIVSNIADMTEILAGIGILAAPAMIGIMLVNYVIGKSLGFVKEIADAKKQYKIDKNTVEFTRELTRMIVTIGGTIAVLALVSTLVSLKDIGMAAIMLFTTLYIAKKMMNLLSSIDSKKIKDSKDSIKVLRDMFVILIGVSISLIIIGKISGDGSFIKGLGAIFSVALVSMLLIKILSSDSMNKRMKTALDNMRSLSVTILILAGTCLLISLLGDNASKGSYWMGLLSIVALLGVLVGAIALLSLIKKSSKAGIEAMKDLTIILLGLVGVSLLLIIVGDNQKKIRAGLGIIGIMLVGLLLATFLVNLILKKGSEKKIMSVVAMMLALALGTLLVSLSIILLGNMPFNNLLQGGITVFVILAILAGSILLINKVGFGNAAKRQQSLLAIAGMALYGLALSLVVMIMSNSIIKLGMLDSGTLWSGVVAVGAIVLMVVGTFIAATKLLGSNPLTLAITAVVAGAIIGMALSFAYLVKTVLDFADFFLKLASYDNKELLNAGKNMLTMVGSMHATFGSLMLTASMSLILMPVLVPFRLLMGSIITLFDNYINLIFKYETLKKAVPNLDNAGKTIAEGFSSFISGLYSISLKQALFVAVLSLFNGPFREMIETCSMFVDMVAKLATMQIIEGFDERGKPIYKTVDPNDFKNAAEKIAEGFATFIKNLSSALKEIGVWGIILIMLLGDSLNPIMESLSMFIDAILKLASSTYISGYDDSGKPIYEKVTPEMFESAAVKVVDSFSYFMIKLHESLKGKSGEIEDILDDLEDGIGELMKGISDYVNGILKFATNSYISGYDEEGKPIYSRVTNAMFGTASANIANFFVSFLKTLHAKLGDISSDVEDVLDDLEDGVGPIMEGLSSYIDAILKFASFKVIAGYDDKGNPILEDLSYIDSTGKELKGIQALKQAGLDVGNMFIGFFTSLYDSINSPEGKKAFSSESLALFKTIGEMSEPLMESFSTFIDSIAMIANPEKLYAIKGYDDKGKPIYDLTKPISVTGAAKSLRDIFIGFISNLVTYLANNQEKFANIQTLIKPFGTSMTEFSKALKPFIEVAVMMKDLDMNEIEKKTDKLFDIVSKAFGTSDPSYAITTMKISDAQRIATIYQNIETGFKSLKNISEDIKKISENSPVDIDKIFKSIHDGYAYIGDEVFLKSYKTLSAYMPLYTLQLTMLCTLMNRVMQSSVDSGTSFKEAFEKIDDALTKNREKRMEALTEFVEGVRGLADNLSIVASSVETVRTSERRNMANAIAARNMSNMSYGFNMNEGNALSAKSSQVPQSSPNISYSISQLEDSENKTVIFEFANTRLEGKLITI